MTAVVCVDFGSTFTKASLVDLGVGRIVAAADHPTTLPVPGEAALDRDRSFDGTVDVVECEEEPVTGALDQLAAVLGDDRPHRLVVPAHHPAPRVVAERLGKAGRVDDVREDEGTQRSHGIRSRAGVVTTGDAVRVVEASK